MKQRYTSLLLMNQLHSAVIVILLTKGSYRLEPHTHTHTPNTRPSLIKRSGCWHLTFTNDPPPAGSCPGSYTRDCGADPLGGHGDRLRHGGPRVPRLHRGQACESGQTPSEEVPRSCGLTWWEASTGRAMLPFCVFFFFFVMILLVVYTGRIKQLIELGMLSTASIRLFVLDEADKLLEEGSFQEQIK